MATKLTKAAVERAIDHLVRYGDTDVLPFIPENVFLSEKRDAIAKEVSSLNLDEFRPMQAVEIISPKSRYGFRIVHQLPLLETLLFTAAIIEIGSALEKLKRPKDEFGPFAYRFDPKGGASLFEENRSYRDWLQWQFDLLSNEKFDAIIYTDIADYYQRIYLHRIENILDTATNKRGINNFITQLIKQIRSKQSHGIPVGGSAARVLAEALLSDTDSALADEGFRFTRYMDDYRIFVHENQSAYEILAFIAEQLATSEGLSLNAHKTRVLPAASARMSLAKQLVDVYDEAQQDAIETLTHALYLDEPPDPADVDKLRSMNLLAALEKEIEAEFWDFTKIRTLFLGLRLTEDDEAVGYLTDRLATFIPFVKDVVLFFDIMHEKGKLDASQLGRIVEGELLNGAARSVSSIRVWLLELAVRGCLSISGKTLNELEGRDTSTNRQIYLIRGLRNDTNYFRRNKTRFEQKNAFEKYHFVLGATCLPADEFRAWLSAISGGMARPLDQLFCNWVKGKEGASPRYFVIVLSMRETEGTRENYRGGYE